MFVNVYRALILFISLLTFLSTDIIVYLAMYLSISFCYLHFLSSSLQKLSASVNTKEKRRRKRKLFTNFRSVRECDTLLVTSKHCLQQTNKQTKSHGSYDNAIT